MFRFTTTSALRSVELGLTEKNTALLEQAVDTFNESLKELTHEREPRDWAMTQNNLGLGLTALGVQKNNTALLDQAVDAFNEASKEYTREGEPFNWATTQFALGVALTALGKQEKNTARLKQAVDVFNEASKELPERVPLAGPRPSTTSAMRSQSWASKRRTPRGSSRRSTL